MAEDTVNIRRRALDLGLAGLVWAAVSPLGAQTLAELLRETRMTGEVPAFENEYVRVHYTVLAYGSERQAREATRPVLLYVSLSPGPGRLNTRPLLPPRGAREAWRPGVLPRGVSIEALAPPPRSPELGTAGTDPPRGTTEDNRWDGGRLLVATFRPLDYAVGAGPYPSVTTFLSDGVVEVSTRGLRRRMAVQAGDAFWLDAATRITVVDDYPVGAAIVQLIAPR